MNSLNSDEAIDESGVGLAPSILLNEESRRHSLQDVLNREEVFLHLGEFLSDLDIAKAGEISSLRKGFADYFHTTPLYTNMVKAYDICISSQKLGGVDTEVFIPDEAEAEANQKKVLINLHGGALVCGEKTYAHLESIPIAALAKIKVVSVDYRLGPECQFPAASDDIVAVYQAVLQQYKPEKIGIFGSSAGGLLVSQSIARFQKENLPLPAAIGMFCGGAVFGVWVILDILTRQWKVFLSLLPDQKQTPTFEG